MASLALAGVASFDHWPLAQILVVGYAVAEIFGIGVYAVADILDHTIGPEKGHAPPLPLAEISTRLRARRRELRRYFSICAGGFGVGAGILAAILYILVFNPIYRTNLLLYVVIVLLSIGIGTCALFVPPIVVKYLLERHWLKRSAE